ncbi:MAG: hypothetical protein JWO69_926 [Thermoleophilia bacterium]|nr:hypothetical protein [Thermoleophilia bacterium]
MSLHVAPKPGDVHRAAELARGPHACPWCESPTWTQPPVPWPALRDYVARCGTCERPIQVRIDPTRVVRRGEVRLPLGSAVEEVDRMLDAPGAPAFVRRLLAASAAAVLLVAAVVAMGTPTAGLVLLVPVVLVACALWAPGIAALLGWAIARPLHTDRSLDTPVEIDAARWDQWLREARRRQVDREQHPGAVLAELERMLDPRELRRVRALAEHGEMPAASLDDLLEFRRSWTSVA